MADVLSERYNNKLRPYGQMLEQHDATVATIILYTRNPEEISEAYNTQKDYLTSFNKRVHNLSSKDTTAEDSNSGQDEKAIKRDTLDGVNPYYMVFNNFSLLGVSERQEQIVKIQNNFGGDWNAFFFGDRPTVYSFTGFFIDSKIYPYYQEFMVAYDKFLKARKTIEKNMEMVVSYNGKMVKGYLLNIQNTTTSENPLATNFMFTVLVQKETWFRMNWVSERNDYQFNGLSNSNRIRSITPVDDDRDIGAIY